MEFDISEHAIRRLKQQGAWQQDANDKKSRKAGRGSTITRFKKELTTAQIIEKERKENEN